MEVLFAVFFLAALLGSFGPLVYYRMASVLHPKRHSRPTTKRYTIRVGVGPAKARQAVEIALTRMGTRLTPTSDPNAICGLTRIAFATNGELVTVWLEGAAAETVVEVESTPVIIGLVADWGRNARNVESVLASVAEALPPAHRI